MVLEEGQGWIVVHLLLVPFKHTVSFMLELSCLI